jgi:hypothetical protein
MVKQDTKYHKAIHVEIWVACSIYKLAPAANPFICSELFTIGKSTKSLVIHVNLFMPSMLYIEIWFGGQKVLRCNS